MKKKINFYTDEQNNIIKKELQAGKLTVSQIAKKYSELWKRPFHSLYLKINKMRTNPESTRTARKGIVLQEGWSFDIANIKRAVLHSNSSVTLYF
jgi:hypothetical protein